jgi:hypothetical protein
MKPNNFDLVVVWMANYSSSFRYMLSTITWLLSLQWNLWSRTCFWSLWVHLKQVSHSQVNHRGLLWYGLLGKMRSKNQILMALGRSNHAKCIVSWMYIGNCKLSLLQNETTESYTVGSHVFFWGGGMFIYLGYLSLTLNHGT